MNIGNEAAVRASAVRRRAEVVVADGVPVGGGAEAGESRVSVVMGVLLGRGPNVEGIE
ncbi:hypothetical protein GCM10008944_12140 [Cytobacillus oceanisediminis]